jgi:hypothetical protein
LRFNYIYMNIQKRRETKHTWITPNVCRFHTYPVIRAHVGCHVQLKTVTCTETNTIKETVSCMATVHGDNHMPRNCHMYVVCHTHFQIFRCKQGTFGLFHLLALQINIHNYHHIQSICHTVTWRRKNAIDIINYAEKEKQPGSLLTRLHDSLYISFMLPTCECEKMEEELMNFMAIFPYQVAPAMHPTSCSKTLPVQPTPHPPPPPTHRKN